MIHMGIHIGVKAIFMRRIFAPCRARLRRHQLDFDDGFDAFEAVFPRDYQPDRRAILRRQRTAINSAGQNRQRMQRLVQAQSLHIRPVQHISALTRHPGGIHQGFESNKFGAAERLNQVQQFGQGKADPRYHH